MSKTYWEDTQGPKPEYTQDSVPNGGILIVGSGFAGVSTAYHLLNQGVTDITIVDNGTENAAWARNAGHILHGTGEIPIAMEGIHGKEKADRLSKISEGFCDLMENVTEKIYCDYRSTGYFRLPSDPQEWGKLRDSKKFFERVMLNKAQTRDLGFNTILGGLMCNNSADGHPAKFRNQLLQHCIDKGVRYTKKKINRVFDTAVINYVDTEISQHDAVVLATNAYTKLISDFVADRGLIEPFKGQIIVSKPVDEEFPWKGPWSMDSGHIYGNILPDNRILIGGWRNNVPGKEVGKYDHDVNPEVEQGLKDTAAELFGIDFEWEYSWAGIMGSTNGGLPLIGPTNSDRVFLCAGFTGYGFSWAHGSAKLLVDIMMGNDLIEGWEYFNPRR